MKFLIMLSPCLAYWFHYSQEAELPFDIPFMSLFSGDEDYEKEKNIYVNVPFTKIKDREIKRLKTTLVALVIPIFLCVLSWFSDEKNQENLFQFFLFSCSAPLVIFAKGVFEYYYTCKYFRAQ
ncbi:hypothetical protein XM47_12375 [Catenovulum maritimum]|uniref:Uncharacterized protein n=1 Tax=Catenovulum maritimum TaxID=1513271 RepID=A0A0J8GPW0_9ALTE|nr:hypothetical protein XM47_12375 [Catenovulum maritimum]